MVGQVETWAGTSPAAGQRRSLAAGAALAGYVALAVLFFGLRVLVHPQQAYVGGLAADPQIFIWAFAWWPHAILHGENPFYTHAIWAPTGFNLAWATSVPGLALAFAPLTVAFGPVASYNAACVLMPALAAWTAFLLCRHLTSATWPSLVGGYLFGFSSYVLAGTLDHIHTTAVFVLPLVALLVLRFLAGDLTGRRLVLFLGPLLALQLSFSTEVLFTSTLALACALLLAFALAPALRRRLLSLLAPLAGAYVFGLVLAAPFVYYLLTGIGSKPLAGAENFVADAANLLAPTHVLAAGWWARRLAEHFPAGDAESGAYLGLPTLVIVGWFALQRRRAPAGRFLVASLALAVLASLGSWLTLAGRRVVTLPWIHLAHLPLFDNVMPARLSVYAALAASVTVALWAASSRPAAWLRATLSSLAVLAVVPNLSLGVWARSPHVPALYTTSLYRNCLTHDEVALVFPFGARGDSMLWQAETGFWFRLAGGYVSPKVPEAYAGPGPVSHLTTTDNPTELTPAAVRQLVRLESVETIVVDARSSGTYRALLDGFAVPQTVGGVLVYRLDKTARPGAACESGDVRVRRRR